MREMRRKDRMMSSEFAYSVIDRAEYGTLATINEDGFPYAVPLSIARAGNSIYFHAAKEGQKLDNIMRDPRVCLSFACGVYVPPVDVDTFTTEYESAIVFGNASIVEDLDERILGLRLISEKFSPDSMPFFDKVVEKALPATVIVRVDIEHISGKRLKYGSDGKQMKSDLSEHR